MVESIRHLDYEERLKVLDLPSLYYKRDRDDMISVYNILHGSTIYIILTFLRFSTTTHTRGHITTIKDVFVCI